MSVDPLLHGGAPEAAATADPPATPAARAGRSATGRAAAVRLMILDVDGVLTDGRLYFGPQGEALKVFDVRDGLGIKLLRDAGIRTAILSARRSPLVDVRARELRIDHVVQGCEDKAAGFAALCATTGLPAAVCGFIGDDWADLPVLRVAGFAATVADAAPEVKAVAHWIAPAPGGRGAVRALAEFVLRAQGRFEGLLATYDPGQGQDADRETGRA